MRALVAVAVFAVACSPYERRSGEYFAGAVDPAAFPAPYLGAGGDPKHSGGVILASNASAHTDPAPYYAFAVSAAQAASDDPLAVSTENNPTAIPAPLAYVFDPQLPAPADMAGVDLGPASGLGPQKIGWFDHYLLTYLDGGYVPTASVVVPGMAGNPDTIVVHIIAQNVYFPTAVPTTLPSGVVVPRAGKLGSGYDVLDARRGEPGYSPLCHVFSFVPPDPLHPPTNAADIDAAQLHDTGTFVWCLQ